MYAAATNAAAYMYDTVESMYREIQGLRHGAHTHNDDQVHGPCWEEDKDDGWLMIMTPKLQREADRQRSLMRAMSLHPDQRFVCSICLDLLPFDEIFLSSACLSQCGQCCRDCSTDYVLSRISDQSFPVTCPSANCILSQQDVGGLLDEPNMLRYLMLERWDYVRKNPRCVVCPRPSADGNGCPGIVEMDEGGTIFVCPVCEHRRCVRCDVEAGAITAMSVIGFLALLTCRSISGRQASGRSTPPRASCTKPGSGPTRAATPRPRSTSARTSRTASAARAAAPPSSATPAATTCAACAAPTSAWSAASPSAASGPTSTTTSAATAAAARSSLSWHSQRDRTGRTAALPACALSSSGAARRAAECGSGSEPARPAVMRRAGRHFRERRPAEWTARTRG